MRKTSAVLLIASLAACGIGSEADQAQRIELRVLGVHSRDITLTRSGKGYVHEDVWLNRKGRAFDISPTQAAGVFRRFEPLLARAEPVTIETLRRVEELRCQDGSFGANDMGGVYVHWIGDRLNVQYFANFNCNYSTNEAFYHRLDELVESIPTSSTH